MKRTTLDLDPAVLREITARSAAQQRSMSDIASELLASALGICPGDATPEPFHWVSADLGEPLVDLSNREAVRRIAG